MVHFVSGQAAANAFVTESTLAEAAVYVP